MSIYSMRIALAQPLLKLLNKPAQRYSHCLTELPFTFFYFQVDFGLCENVF